MAYSWPMASWFESCVWGRGAFVEDVTVRVFQISCVENDGVDVECFILGGNARPLFGMVKLLG